MTELARLLALAGLRFDDLLLEGAKDRYNQLFQNVPADLKDNASLEVQWAMQNLKREDRIVWYLRYARVAMLDKVRSEDPAFQQLRDKTLRDLATKSKVSPPEAKRDALFMSSSRAKLDLAHSISMEDQITKIGKYVFGTQRPDEVINVLEAIEEEWKEENEGKNLPATDEDDGAEKIIDFGDGFAWWNLGRGSCSLEGRAMGHCGNVPSEKSGDRVLSLRKRGTVGGKNYDMPFLTFILNRDNKLGEMKGRGNEKPAPRYHKYIVALLLNDIVEGIKGGGYAPQNNFSLKDLPEEQREELLKKKPELQRGQNFEDKVALLRAAGISGEFRVEGNNVVVWEDRLKYIEGNTEWVNVLERMMEAVETSPEAMVTPAFVIGVCKALETSDLARLARIAGVDMPKDFGSKSLEDFGKAVYDSTDARQFIESVLTSTGPGYDKDDVVALAGGLIYGAAPLAYAEGIDLYYQIKGNIFDDYIQVCMSKGDFEQLVDEVEEDDDYAEWRRFQIGWFQDYSDLDDYLKYNADHIDQNILNAFKAEMDGKSATDVSDPEEFAPVLAQALILGPKAYRPADMDDLFANQK